MQRFHTSVLAAAFFIASLLCGTAQAADRMHMVIVQGVTVAGAGTDAMNASLLYEDWKKLTNTTGKLVWIIQDTRQGNREKVLAAFDQLGEIGERDIVFFYYTGHGAIDQETGHFFQLDDRSSVTRKEVREKMQRLGARLNVIVSDCCAVVVPPRRFFGKAMDPPDVMQRVVGNLGRLFAVNGIVDINSSAKDQIAWGTGTGGLFTKEFKRILSQERVDDWDGFTQTLKVATEKSYEAFRERNIAQGGRPDMLGESDLADVQNQESQTPEIYALEVRGDDGGNTGGQNPPPPPANGVVVTEVFEDTTAKELFLNGQQMKLDVGDRIVAINGMKIRNAEHFAEVIDSLRRGAAVTVSVVDTNTGNVLQLRGKLDVGGDYRFGARVNDQ